MSIATAIQNARQKIETAYTAISNKGGTLPTTQDLSNMPDSINSIQTSIEPAIESITINPSTSEQIITAPSGVDGYSPITVVGVTYDIDSNITSSNIKYGVTILGVTGNVEELNATSLSVSPSTSSQNFTPSNPYNGYSEVNVSAVTSSIDSNITAGNIKEGVTILGITGTYSGITPSGTISITSNGIYNVTNYANASVNVSGGGGYSELPSYQVSSGIASRRSGALIGNEFSNITTVGNYCLYYTFYGHTGLTGALDLSSVITVEDYGLSYSFYGCTGLTGVDLSSLTTVGRDGLSYSFEGCTGLTSALDLSSLTTVRYHGLYYSFFTTNITSVDLSSLTTTGGYSLYHSFDGCTNITSVDLSSLTTVGDYDLSNTFRGCTGLTSVNLSSLTTVGNNGLNNSFQGCTGLASVNLSSLTSIGYSFALSAAFYGCTGLENVYFPALTTTSFGSYKNQFSNLLSGTGTTKTHTLHFPSNLEATISDLGGYPNFSGTSGYVTLAFDLPATS